MDNPPQKKVLHMVQVCICNLTSWCFTYWCLIPHLDPADSFLSLHHSHILRGSFIRKELSWAKVIGSKNDSINQVFRIARSRNCNTGKQSLKKSILNHSKPAELWQLQPASSGCKSSIMIWQTLLSKVQNTKQMLWISVVDWPWLVTRCLPSYSLTPPPQLDSGKKI